MSSDHPAEPTASSLDRPASEPISYNEILILLGIMLIAGWLRFTGIEWGKNLYLHPDERFQTMVVVAAHWPKSIGGYFDSAQSPLNPYNNGFGSYIYGTFPLFAAKLIGTITGNQVYGDAHLPGRAFSAICDLVTVLLVYLTGRRLFGVRTGLLAAALAGVTVLQIQSAHYFTSDSAVVVMCLAAFYLSLRAESSGRLGWYAASGLAVGLATASKINALPIALVLALPVFDRWRETGLRSIWRSGSRGRVAPVVGMGLAVLIAVWTFRFAQPYAFTGPNLLSFRLDQRWLNDLRYWRDVQNGVGDSPPSMQWADRTPILFSLRNLVLWGMGPLLGLTAIAALVIAAIKMVAAKRIPPGWQLILVGWPAFHLVYYGIGFVQTMRYLLPAYPFLVLLAAALLIRIADWGTARGWGSLRLGRRFSLPWAALPAVVVLLGTFFYAVGFVGIYTRTTTREAASRWFYANVPPGSVVASEHWDDGIPVSLPGFDTQQYTGFQLELFFPDDAAKLEKLTAQLNEADYLVVTSNRLYATIPRIPERYPMTSEYYRLLFSGGLGFDLVHVETSYPTYLGQELNDDGAEEAFTVYDHPKVFIFRKNDAFNATEISARLSRALEGGAYAISPLYAGEHLLLMDNETRLQQQASGTWRTMFDPGGFANQYPVVIWYLALQIMALAAVPLCWRLFDSLPDRGYGVAKTVGVLGASYVAWLLASLKVTAFGPDTVGLGVIVIGALSGFLVRDRLRAMIRDLGDRWRMLVLVEGLFLLCYLAAVTVRGHNPDLWEPSRGGEKPMDFAYFNAVLKSTSFPPFDPWFAGGYMHYYYFGFVQWASLTRLTGIVPEVAYNLAVPSIFALLCLNVWSAAAALIAGIRREPGAPNWRVPLGALLAPLFVAMLGNLDLVQRIGRGEFGYPAQPIGILAPLGGLGDIVAGIWNATLHHPARPSDIYWPSTRVVPGTINEYPAFSVLFADLHAHLMAMPLASAALVLACQLVLRNAEHQAAPQVNWRDLKLREMSDRWGRTIAEGIAAGFIASALYATNTWDYPTYLALLVGAVAIRECARVRWSMTYPLIVRVGLWTIGVVAAGRVLFWPFYASFHPQSGIVRQPERTPVGSYLTIHGLFLLALAGFVVMQLRPRRPGRSIRQSISASARAAARASTGIVDESGHTLQTYISANYSGLVVPAVGVIAAGLIVIGLATDRLSVALLGSLMLVGIAAWRSRDEPIRLFTLLLGGVALGLGLVTEQVALMGDIGRMNTVFKLYLQAWLLFGVVAAVAIAAVWSNHRPRPGAPRWVWSAALLVLISASALYPAIAIPARVGDRFAALPVQLDGMAYMDGATYSDAPEGREPVNFPLADDRQAIDWLRTNVDGSPVVLEATTPGYRWGSRVSIYTGLPTVLGWDWHETQQRPGFGMMIAERRDDVQRMLGATTSFSAIQPLLDKYHVQLIYVGDLERAYYDASALSKFDAAVQSGALTVIYQQSGVTIYRYENS